MKPNYIEVLETFSPAELKEFKAFLNSPFYNTNKSLLRFYSYNLSILRMEPSKVLSKEKVFKKVYPGKKYNEESFKTLVFNFNKVLDEFLIQKSLERHPFDRSILHIKELSRRSLERRYDKKVKYAEKLLSKQSPALDDYFDNFKILETIKSDNLLSKKDLYKEPNQIFRRGDYVILAFLMKFIFSLEDVYLLRDELNYEEKDNLTLETEKHINLAYLIKYLEKKRFVNSHYISLKYYEYLALKDLNFESYEKYKNIFDKYSEKLGWSDKFVFLGTLNSICIMGEHTGKQKFSSESNAICKLMVDENSYAFRPEEYTEVSRFYNLVIEFTNKKEWDYFDRVINEFGKKLDPNLKASFINYAYMLRYFNERKFEEALNCNKDIEFNHTLLKNNMKITLMKLYYELGYTEELLYLLDTSLKYYNNVETYSQFKIERAINFIKYLKKIVIYSDSKNYTRMDELVSEIECIQNINSKLWLMEKIKERAPEKNKSINK